MRHLIFALSTMLIGFAQQSFAQQGIVDEGQFRLISYDGKLIPIRLDHVIGDRVVFNSSSYPRDVVAKGEQLRVRPPTPSEVNLTARTAYGKASWGTIYWIKDVLTDNSGKVVGYESTLGPIVTPKNVISFARDARTPSQIEAERNARAAASEAKALDGAARGDSSASESVRSLDGDAADVDAAR